MIFLDVDASGCAEKLQYSSAISSGCGSISIRLLTISLGVSGGRMKILYEKTHDAAGGRFWLRYKGKWKNKTAKFRIE